MGIILMIDNLDHLQIQPIGGRSFLLAHSIIPCLKMVSFKCSVRAYGDEFVELQSITQKYYNEFDSDQELIQRSRCICSHIFSYVDSRDDKIIKYHTYRLFRKNIQEEKLYINSIIFWFRSISIILIV